MSNWRGVPEDLAGAERDGARARMISLFGLGCLLAFGLSGCVTTAVGGAAGAVAAQDAGAFLGGAVAGYVNERQAAPATPAKGN